MDEPLLPTANNKLTERAGYIAALVGIAVFLSLLMLFPEPIQHYTARAVVEQTAPGNLLQVRFPLSRLAAQQSIDATLQDFRQRESLTHEPQVEVQEEQLASGKMRLMLYCRERYASQTLLLLGKITQNLVDAQPTAFQPAAENQQSQEDDILRRLSLSKEAEQGIEDALHNAQQDHVTKSLALMLQISQQQTEQSQQPEISNEWTVAAQKLKELEAKRNELLSTRTEIHPLVQEVDFQLQQVQELLQSLPAPELNVVEEKNNFSQLALRQLQALQKEHELQLLDLRQQKNQSTERQTMLERELLKLAQPIPSVALKTQITEQPNLIQKGEGGSGIWRISLLSITAVLTAVGVYRLASKWPLASVIEHVDQVKRDLGLSVVGVAKLRRRPHIHEKQKQILKNAVMAIELVVLLLALSMFYAVGTSKQLVSEPLADPFGAMAEALDQAAEPTIIR
jgi:hypothetical protein